MKLKEQDTKEKLIQRLHRIEGQVRGVETMLEEERDCREILQQLSAIHSAIQGVSRLFLQDYATSCLMEIDEGELGEGTPTSKTERLAKREKLIQDMIALLDKAP